MTHYGQKAVFGTNPCPDLPKGFRIVRIPGCLARAISARRKHFLIFLNPNRLVPIIRPKNKKRRNPHVTWADFDRAIPF